MKKYRSNLAYLRWIPPRRVSAKICVGIIYAGVFGKIALDWILWPTWKWPRVLYARIFNFILYPLGSEVGALWRWT